MAPSPEDSLLSRLSELSEQFLRSISISVAQRLAHLDHSLLDNFLLRGDKTAISSSPFSSEAIFAIDLIQAISLRDRIFESSIYSDLVAFAISEESSRSDGFQAEIVCYFIARYLHAYAFMVRSKTRRGPKRMLSVRLDDYLFQELSERARIQNIPRSDYVANALAEALQRSRGRADDVRGGGPQAPSERTRQKSVIRHTLP
jgi:hypothetical protein